MTDAGQIVLIGVTTTFIILLSMTIIMYAIARVVVWGERKKTAPPRQEDAFSGEDKSQTVAVANKGPMVALVTAAVHSWLLQSGASVQEPSQHRRVG